MNLLSQERINIIKSRIEQAFTDIQYLEIIDESDQHRGHAGYGEGSRHFAVIIAAFELSLLTKVAAHRMIYALFHDMMPSPIHALRINILKS
jgi:BolA protein